MTLATHTSIWRCAACGCALLVTLVPGVSTFASASFAGSTTQALQACEALIEQREPKWVVVGLTGDTQRVSNDSANVRRALRSLNRGLQAEEINWSPESLGPDANVSWTRLLRDQQFVGARIETRRAVSADVSGDVSVVQELWVFDARCRLQRHVRQLSGQGVLQLFPNPAVGTSGVQLIDAPLPVLPVRKGLRVRVALVDSGVNYTLPAIRRGLARDANGAPLGYDFWDNDARPFDAHPAPSPYWVGRHGTRTASVLLDEAPQADLVVYRYPRPDMTRMQELVRHADALGVRVIGMPLGGNREQEWQSFANVAKQHPHILFVASAGNNGRDIDVQPVYPASLSLANLLVVTSADDFVRPAQRVNWGRGSVDYMIQAEGVSALNHDGERIRVSGSSYAVPRVVAMAVHWLEQHPDWDAQDLLKEFARRYATGTYVRDVGGGFIHDPLAARYTNTIPPMREVFRWPWLPEHSSVRDVSLQMPVDVLVLHDSWTRQRISRALNQASALLRDRKSVV